MRTCEFFLINLMCKKYRPQQKMSLYAKWILSEFIGCNEHGPMKK
jgi:hypothetical protein